MSNFISRLDSKWTGVFAAVITIGIWALFIVVARASAKLTLTPLDIVFARLLSAAIILAPCGFWITRHARKQQRAQRVQRAQPGQTCLPPPSYSLLGFSPLPLKPTLVLGFFGSLFYAPLAYTAFFFAPAAHGAVLMPGTLPLSTALAATFLLGERFSRQRALGLVLIACGGLMVGGASLLSALNGENVWIGDILFVCASSGWAMYSVLARKYQVNALHATVAITVFGAMIYVPIYGLLVILDALPLALQSHWFDAPWQEIAMQMLMQGIGSVVISGTTFTLMLKYFGPVRTTMMTALVPSIAALSAVALLGEPLYWNLIAGLLLALTGVFLGIRQPPHTKTTP